MLTYVEGLSGVSDVLSGVEHTERLASEPLIKGQVFLTRPAKKSREESNPATGRSRNPVQSCKNLEISSERRSVNLYACMVVLTKLRDVVDSVSTVF